jgi:hypothetical protein
MKELGTYLASAVCMFQLVAWSLHGWHWSSSASLMHMWWQCLAYVYESMVAELWLVQTVYYAGDLSDGWAEASAAQGSREMRGESSMDRAHGLLACSESQDWPRDGDGWQAIDN